MQGRRATDEELAAWLAHFEREAFGEWVELQPGRDGMRAALKTVNEALSDGFQPTQQSLEVVRDAAWFLSLVALGNGFVELGRVFEEMYREYCSMLEQR